MLQPRKTKVQIQVGIPYFMATNNSSNRMNTKMKSFKKENDTNKAII